MLNKLIFAVTLGLFALNFTPVLAQVMEIEVVGGGYRLRGPDIIEFGDVTASFAAIESIRNIRDLHAQDEELLASNTALDYIAIEDQNGGNPFQVTVTATNFVSGPNSIGNANFEIKNADDDPGTGDPDDIIPDNAQTTETGVALDADTDDYADLSTDRTLFTNSEGRAPGAWRIFPVFRVNIPAETPPGVYNSTLTFTII